MTTIVSLLKRDFIEQIRTYKLLIVSGVFIFFGITTPLTLKFLPQIIKLVGEQMTIDIPPPTAVQSLLEYAGTIGQVGVLVAVLVAMGCIANEFRQGTALMILSKPISRTAFVSAKLVAMSFTFLISMIAASIFCYVYTIWLIETADLQAFIGMNLLLGLFLIFCLAITLLFSSLFKNSLAAGGLAIAVIIGQAGLSAIPVIGDYLPGKILTWGNNLLTGNSDKYWWALLITIIVIFLCVYLAQYVLKKKDL